MSERSTEDTAPLVPRRTLSGAPPETPEAPPNGRPAAQPGRSLGERLAAARASAGQAVAQATGRTEESRAQAAPPAPPPTVQRPAATPTPAAAPAAAAPAPASSARPSSTRARVRRARLRLTHIDPWSVMKTAFLLAVAVGIVTVVAVAVVWAVLGVAGVWDSINNTVADVLGEDSTKNFDVRDYLGTSRVLGFTMIVAVVDVVLLTALATLAAFLYNLSAALLGGIEVTLSEDER